LNTKLEPLEPQLPRSISKPNKLAPTFWQITRAKRDETSPAKKLKQKIDLLGFFLADAGPSPELLQRKEDAVRELKAHEEQLKRSAYAAHRSTLYQEKITKEFFHSFTSAYANHYISSVYITPDWTAQPIPANREYTEDDDEIAEAFRSYCEHLFSPKPSLNPEPLLAALRTRTVPSTLQKELDQPITLDEVSLAIRKLAKGKTP
jgi:hypothetical protein